MNEGKRGRSDTIPDVQNNLLDAKAALKEADEHVIRALRAAKRAWKCWEAQSELLEAAPNPKQDELARHALDAVELAVAAARNASTAAALAVHLAEETSTITYSAPSPVTALWDVVSHLGDAWEGPPSSRPLTG